MQKASAPSLAKSWIPFLPSDPEIRKPLDTVGYLRILTQAAHLPVGVLEHPATVPVTTLWLCQQFAIENDGNSEFSHQQWWFSTGILV